MLGLFVTKKSFGYAYEFSTEELNGINDPIYDEETGEEINVDDIIEGIGRVYKSRGGNPKDIVKLRKVVATTKKRAVKTQKYRDANTTAGQMFIADKGKDLPVHVQNQIAKGKMKYTDKILYHILYGQASLKGIIELFQAQNNSYTVYDNGYSSFEDKGKIENNTNVAVEFISLELLENYVLANGLFSKAFTPAADNSFLASAILVIEQDSEDLLSIPIAKMTESRIVKDKVLASDDANGYNLNQKILFKAGATIQAKIKMPNGVGIDANATANKLAIKIGFFGDGTKPRA